MLYLWIKAFHVIAMVAWFAGLFYLPRLFVYHSMPNHPQTTERFITMERRLFWGIMTPAAIVTIILGLWLLSQSIATYMSSIWMHVKLAMVLLLIAYHILCGYHQQCFKNDRNKKSPLYFRIMNEVPVIMLIVSVVMVIVRPF